MVRAKRQYKTSNKKKSQHGNRYVTPSSKKCIDQSALSFEHLNVRPLIQHPEELKDKISSNEEYFDEYSNECIEYDLMNVQHLNKIIFQHLRCSKCNVKSLNFEVRKRIGLASYFDLTCKKCSFKVSFSNSTRQTYELVDETSIDQEDVQSIDGNEQSDYDGDEQSDDDGNEQSDEESNVQSEEESKEKRYRKVELETINIAFVNAARLSGCGHTAGTSICTYMNLNPPNQHNWEDIQDHLHVAYQKRAEWSMQRAVEEAKQQALVTTGKDDLTASLDGSWMRRGRASLAGFVLCIALFTNKIIGIDVRHKYCPMCKGKGECKYGNECRINYNGSSGGMEPVGAASIFKEIFKKYGVKITQYLGDGDSRAFSRVRNEVSWPIQKLECMNHIAKRMGGRLRNKVKENKNFEIQGQRHKGLDGKGRLTGKAINMIQQYYSWIIYRSINDVEKMKSRVLAMFEHIASSDDDPMHDNCDPIFCKFQLAIASGEEYFHDEHFHLPRVVMDKVKDVFDDLSKEDLLEKVAHGKTQNANECANSTVWNLLSKNGFANRRLVELTGYMAICLYNDGKIAVMDVLSSLGVPIGKEMLKRCKAMDRLRVSKKRKVQSKLLQRKKQRTTEDDEYDPGMGEY